MTDVMTWLVARLAAECRIDVADVDVNRPFSEFGLGSVQAVAVAGDLEELLDTAVSPTLLWEHPTIHRLAAHLTAGASPASEPSAVDACEPIAVIGIGCRLPGGVDSPARLWEFLRRGGDAVGEVPHGRWDEYAAADPALVARTTRFGAFLEDVAGFDAPFFGISPREAATVDPQQRLMLEVCWEALEHAGIPPLSLAGSATGVFAGACGDDYGRRQFNDLTGIEAWSAPGSALSIIANRVSYHFDLKGPSVTVDTACSSSLVAVHLGASSLRSGESDMVLAGGVNLLLSPAVTIGFDRAGALAPDGRCKPFDASADGYGRGEGCAVVVLKRLSDARAAGDRVLAVIRGSAVGQDGRSNGLMAPNPAGQADVLRAACAAAGVRPSEVGYVEAHGTGTPLGDPIEVAALASVFGAGRAPGAPLLIGSAKSNFGHLEAAAGVVGLIKTVLSVRHAEIPPTLHFADPNPRIPFDRVPIRVAAARTPWHAPGRLAGVSSFGFGGTNAHAIVEGVEEADRPVGGDLPVVVPVSAGDREGLGQAVDRLLTWMTDHPDTTVQDVASALARRRSHLPARLAVVAADLSDLKAGLAAGVRATTRPQIARKGPVFVFPGQGSRLAGVSRELLGLRAFGDALAEIEPVVAEESGFSLRALLEADAEPHGVDRLQPLIFAIQVGMAAAWQAAGVVPAAVIGQSVGEAAAAVVAGALSVQDGARLVCRRSRLLARVAGKGAMAVIELAACDVETLLRERGLTDRMVVAVRSGPRSTVVAGDAEAVRGLAGGLGAGLARLVRVDLAAHSPHVDDLLDELRERLGDLRPRPLGLPFFSTVLDDPRDVPAFDPDYWAANLRREVRFTDAARVGAEAGYTTFVEMSPRPLVAEAIADTLADAGLPGSVTPGMRRGERHPLLAGVAEVYEAGHDIDWSAHYPVAPHVDLPTTPFHRKRHWTSCRAVTGGARPGGLAPHTLRGQEITIAGGAARVWEGVAEVGAMPYPGTHAIRGVPVVPASVLLNTLLNTLLDTLLDTPLTVAGGGAGLRDIRFEQPLTLSTDHRVQVVSDEGGLRLAARDDSETGSWQTIVSAVPAAASDSPAAACEADVGIPVSKDEVVRRLTAAGVSGTAYPWVVRALRSGPSMAHAVLDLGTEGGTWAPALDAALHLAVMTDSSPDGGDAYVPQSADRVIARGRPEARAEVTALVRAADHHAFTVDLWICSGDGSLLVDGVRYVSLDGSGQVSTRVPIWHPREWPAAGQVHGQAHGRVLLLGPRDAFAEAVRRELTSAGIEHDHADGVSELTGTDPLTVVVLPPTVGHDCIAAAQAACLAAAETAAALGRRHDAGGASRLWLTTIGVMEGDTETAAAMRPLCALAGVIAGEYPEIPCGVADLGPHGDLGVNAHELARALSGEPEGTIAVRGDHVLAPVLSDAMPATHPAVRCRRDRAYLVTGGLGALGRHAARALARKGARRLVLLSRRPLPDREHWGEAHNDEIAARVAFVRQLETEGVSVHVADVDVGDRMRLRAFLDTWRRQLRPPIAGIVHAAGVTHDALLAQTSAAGLREVFEPKAAGAYWLHQYFPPGELDFFVLFSSAAALTGAPGQGSYAAANAFLDGLAHLRRAAGDRTLSLNWYAWRGLGLAAGRGGRALDQEVGGLGGLEPADALAAWARAEAAGVAQALVMPPVRLPGAPRRSRPREWTCRPDLAAEVHGLAARRLGLEPDDLDPERPLSELGMDSIMALGIRRDLETLTGLALSVTLLWNRSTTDLLGEYLWRRLMEPPPEEERDDLGESAFDVILTHAETDLPSADFADIPWLEAGHER
ncbi:SDR family NAD(P)-dependent oxidoreductase [Streptosporangiaceae bacterium NEAU-GS5]|nr:SDR family NAD(P)-dependent oxidoreductase [Streptosporangiaceae bacterium NEAU-GS5]